MELTARVCLTAPSPYFFMHTSVQLLFRWFLRKFRERVQSPLWCFIGGQRENQEPPFTPEPFSSDTPAVSVLESAPAEQAALPIAPTEKQQRLIERLLSRFDSKLNAREARKRLAARRAAVRREKQGAAQMELPFDAQTTGADDADIREEAPSVGDLLWDAGEEYILPPYSFFTLEDEDKADHTEEIQQVSKKLQECIDNFNVDADVGKAIRGPRVTLYQVTPAKGVKVSAVTSCADEIKMSLSAETLRVLAPVPGHNYVGIEVPNLESETVRCGNILHGKVWNNTKARLPLILGRNVEGEDVILDLAKAPHLLVAGATGSGKSVCLNSFIVSLITRFRPDEVKLILIDPKVVEMNVYNALPHLIVPVINDIALILLALRWLVYEMERRYRVLAKVNVRNLEDFNNRPPDPEPVYDDDGNVIPQHMNYIVLIVDELADIMATNKKDVEDSLKRLAQKSRAIGIHTVIATQRPSVDVITGTIKSNFPTRIAFKTAAAVDSRVILDGLGAEALLNKGDMLFRPPNADGLQRIQGTMVTDQEIEKVVAFCAAQRKAPEDFQTITVAQEEDTASPLPDDSDKDDEAEDDFEKLVSDAKTVVLEEKKASISYIQRKFKIGYNRAANVMDELQKQGVVGPQLSNGKREILMDTQ